MKYLFTCFAGLILLIGGCSNQIASKDSINIVLITIDTLRADHLSCYGYEQKTSPNIDNIAEKGILFKNVIAPSSWTAPSMVSLFTSVYPINHGVVHGIAPRWNPRKQEIFSKKLTTISEIVKAHGYTTFGVAANFHLSEQFGFARGFDFFQCIPSRRASTVNESVYSWENEIRNSDKFFLWVHYFDPHIPYKFQAKWIDTIGTKGLKQKRDFSRKSFPQLKKLIPLLRTDPKALSNLVDLYDGEINYVDLQVGELIRKFGFDENTLIIITSDHGEELLDHGKLSHGHQLFHETIKIPLIVKLPYSSEKRTVKKYVNLIDVMPTILHILGINPPPQVLGESFWDTNDLMFRSKKILPGKNNRNANFSELDVTVPLKTIITPEWKYIYNYREKTDQLYNIRLDPSELNNLAVQERERCDQLKEKLFHWVKTSKKYPPKEKSFKLTKGDEKKLEALGYLTTQKKGGEDHQGASKKESYSDDN